MPLIPERVIVIDQEFTPAQSSAIPKRIGAVVDTEVAHADGESDPTISQGWKGALIVLENDEILLFRSRILPVMVIGFSMP